jgi:hydroxyacylglutathione hydrolase
MLKIKSYVFSPFQENTFLIIDKSSNNAAIIDPGCMSQSEKQTLVRDIETSNAKLELVINTHLHIDHIFGNKFLCEKYGAKLIYPRGDEFLLPIMEDEAKRFGVLLEPSPKADFYFEEIDKIKLGNSELELLFTPGHTPGEYSIYSEEDSACFTGDVLFQESIGRTDLWSGDYDTLIESIYNKLFTLPDNTVVYPGHGELTTIGHEKNYNPFL